MCLFHFWLETGENSTENKVKLTIPTEATLLSKNKYYQPCAITN